MNWLLKWNKLLYDEREWRRLFRSWHMYILSKYTGVKIHSFWSHIRDHFILEWKSKLKIVESTLTRVIQLNDKFGADSAILLETVDSCSFKTKRFHNISPKRVDLTLLHQESSWIELIPGGPEKTEQSIRSIFQDFALINCYFFHFAG